MSNQFSTFTTDSPDATDAENDERPTHVTPAHVLNKFQRRLSLNKARKEARKLKRLADEQLIEEVIVASAQQKEAMKKAQSTDAAPVEPGPRSGSA